MKKEGAIITKFSDFAEKIYPYTTYSSLANFIKSMLKDLGSFNYGDDYYKSLGNGSKAINKQLISKVSIPFNSSKAFLFFEDKIVKKKISKLASDFDISCSASFTDKVFLNSLVDYLKELLTNTDENINCTVKDKYIDLQVNVTSSVLRISSDDYEFIDEANKKCPHCKRTPLVLISDGKHIRNYSIEYIYPIHSEDLSANDKILFNGVIGHEPSSKELLSFNNRIALCPKCARSYRESKNFIMFQKLVEAKRRFLEDRKFKLEVEKIQIPDIIEQIVDYLIKNHSNFKEADLSLNAIKISDKIPSTDLIYNDVSRWATENYDYINSLLASYEKSTTDAASLLSRQVKALSDECFDHGCTPSQTIETIARKLNERCNGDGDTLIACRLIVAFFVAHCEVLSNETSK